MEKRNVDFIIPTRNKSSAFFQACLTSIQQQKGEWKKTIYVETGIGFAKPVNDAIRKGKSAYIAVVNDDAVLDPGWLSAAMDCIKRRGTTCAAVATRVLTHDGRHIDSCGMDIAAIGKAHKRGNGEEETQDIFQREEEVSGVPASAALFRREALKHVGLFDEDFCAYEEDVDLSLRLRLSGYTIYFAPRAIAFHIGQKTSRSMPVFKAQMDAKNWLYVLIKNYPRAILQRYMFAIFLERIKNLSGLAKEIVSVYKLQSLWMLPFLLGKTYGEVFMVFPRMIRKRTEIQAKKQISDNNIFL